MPDDMRVFTGEPDADLEGWLGDAFESWIPSRRELALTPRGGIETIVQAGQRIVRSENGEVSVRV